MRRSSNFPVFYTAACKTNGSEKPVLRSQPRKAALGLTTDPCSSIPHLQHGPLEISREVWKNRTSTWQYFAAPQQLASESLPHAEAAFLSLN